MPSKGLTEFERQNSFRQQVENGPYVLHLPEVRFLENAKKLTLLVTNILSLLKLFSNHILRNNTSQEVTKISLES